MGVAIEDLPFVMDGSRILHFRRGGFLEILRNSSIQAAGGRVGSRSSCAGSMSCTGVGGRAGPGQRDWNRRSVTGTMTVPTEEGSKDGFFGLFGDGRRTFGRGGWQLLVIAGGQFLLLRFWSWLLGWLGICRDMAQGAVTNGGRPLFARLLSFTLALVEPVDIHIHI